MAWTSVAKPTSSLWTTVTFSGKEFYDDPNVEYDDSDTYYDGVNPLQYTSVPKPTSSLWTKVAKPT